MSVSRNVSRWLGALSVMLLGLSPLRTEAQAPDASASCAEERYLVLTAAPELAEELAREIHTDLATELRARGLGVCQAERADVAPVAHVALRITEATVAIELDDHVTHKRVARDLALASIPPSGRALATAIAVDELLRASWAELTMPKSPAPEPPPQPPREQEPAEQKEPGPLPPEPVPQEQLRVFGLALLGGFGQARESWSAFSASLRANLWPWRWAWLELGASFLQTLTAQDRLGQVSARGFGADVTLGGCPWHVERAFGCLGLRTGVDQIWFSADAAAQRARAQQQRGTAVRLEGVAMLGVKLPHRLFTLAQLSLGAPVQSVVATDGDDALLGLSGFSWSAAVGVGVER